MKHAGIAGCGVIGMLTALRLREAGWKVTLIDADSGEGTQSCTYTGAGMLAPYCELEHSREIIASLGTDSTSRWEQVLCGLDAPVQLDQAGSLAVSHPDDQADLDHLEKRVANSDAPSEVMQTLGVREVEKLEPELGTRYKRGLFFPGEGHINNRELLIALREKLQTDRLVNFVRGLIVHRTEPGRIIFTNLIKHPYDLVVDCRGLGAREQLHNLRGVRGELIYVRAPEVHLRRPIRLMHPRYPLYIVPRRDQIFVIGATQLESDHAGPATLRSALELLSAAYALHTGFAEAEILEIRAALRPAFPDNLPRIVANDGHMHINGLFRHGFLLAPVITEMASEIIAGKPLQDFPQSIVTGPA